MSLVVFIFCISFGATGLSISWSFPCQEYNVRASTSNDKNYFIGRFVTGLPNFSRKKNAENRWSLQKEGLQGRQLTDALRVLDCATYLSLATFFNMTFVVFGD